jgi:hypothetical protein
MEGKIARRLGFSQVRQSPHVDLRVREQVSPIRGVGRPASGKRAKEVERLLREPRSIESESAQPASIARVLREQVLRELRPGSDGSARDHEVMDALTTLAAEHGVTQDTLSGTEKRRPGSSDYRAVRNRLHEMRSHDPASVSDATLRQLFYQHAGALSGEIDILWRAVDEPVSRLGRGKQPSRQELHTLIDRKRREFLALRKDFEK